MEFVGHDWTVVKPLKCQMCDSRSKLMAAYCCISCGNRNYCRPCYRRYVTAHYLSCHVRHLCRFIFLLLVAYSIEIRRSIWSYFWMYMQVSRRNGQASRILRTL